MTEPVQGQVQAPNVIVQFGIGQDQRGFKTPAMIVTSGSLQTTLLIPAESVPAVVEMIASGLTQAAQACRLANGGLEVVGFVPPEMKLNGHQD